MCKTLRFQRLRLTLSKGPNTAIVLPPLPEDEVLCFLVLRLLDDALTS
jgi:hypothetical protein